jgi:hypothetical protein
LFELAVITTLYVPAGVPLAIKGVAWVALLLLPPPPHAVMIATEMITDANTTLGRFCLPRVLALIAMPNAVSKTSKRDVI